MNGVYPGAGNAISQSRNKRAVRRTEWEARQAGIEASRLSGSVVGVDTPGARCKDNPEGETR